LLDIRWPYFDSTKGPGACSSDKNNSDTRRSQQLS
jgi:hypothetical protein